MKGDFSRVRFMPFDNFGGILPQQGKVLLDSDGIAQTLIENGWRETAARDVMGETAAVPAAASNSFQISAASLSGGVVTLTIGTGHLWADGLLVRLESRTGNTVTRTATWLEPPLVVTEGSAAGVAAGVRDAVVLEVWQHAVNGYQMPEELIEPALGGPDTAERLQTSFAFRLARLAAGQTCAGLKFDESGRGALTVSLVPPVVITGDCPVDALGGYSGFEHQLYRIEIADTSGGAAQFKWSRTNGGLVGRGTFDPATHAISITANLPAITSANQTNFYLEIEGYNPALGYSRVLAGSAATLVSGSLQCAATPSFGTYPTASDNVFFRLWDGISPISSFPISATPAQLENGILLQFDADGPGKYLPGDYWMFPVRAQGIANPQVLIEARQPQGIIYHRVPLAEISWASSGANFTGTIEDCRTVVPPLSRNKGCCTCRVGDGTHSFGDFTSIQAAVDSLPAEGGEVCILPGRYFEHLRIIDRRDIVIHGCGWQTRIASPSLAPVPIEKKPAVASNGAVTPINAVITVVGSQHVELRLFAVEAEDDEAGILLDGTGTTLVTNQPGLTRSAVILPRGVTDVGIRNLVITAATLPAILAQAVEVLHVACNRVLMKNVRSLWPAIYASGQEIRIEQNFVGILSVLTGREWLPITVADDLSGASLSSAPSSGSPAVSGAETSPPPECPPEIRDFIDASGLSYVSITVALHPGGIQIGGPSTDVYVLDNEIEGGSRNGITLGSFQVVDANGNDTGQWIGVLVAGEQDNCCGGTLQPPTTPPGGGTIVAGGILRNVHIHRNRIRDMGLCGIGPVGFFNLLQTLEVITIFGLNISRNGISRTLLRDLVALDQSSTSIFGYGAICVPDVQDLIVSDNTITDFGGQPGLAGCGIFVLHGETLVISRNRVLETRDWSKLASTDQSPSAVHGGIVILFATPPAFNQPLDSTRWAGGGQAPAAAAAVSLLAPVYEPGLPAARVEHNVVRVALGCALEIVGFGPFTIANNHLASGGLVLAATTTRPLAQTVVIGNLGTAIDGVSGFSLPSKTLSSAGTPYSGLAASRREVAACGTVLFTGNHCQLEATISRQLAVSSVAIITADHLVFSSNQCWLDASQPSATLDALLLAFSLNVVGNRFQEAPSSVLLSGLTVGTVNVTAENVSTYCLTAFGAMLSNNNNLALVSAVNRDICAGLEKDLQGLFG